MKVLITGGSGYLGSFLVQALRQNLEVEYTYGTRPIEQQPEGVTGYKVNLATGEGLEDAFSQGGPWDAVINCAAISQPGVCEKDPEAAAAVNVPTKLIHALEQQKTSSGKEALLIHVSTDQVYDGSHSFWTEEEHCTPVNVYGRSKLNAELAIQEKWKRHVILRSSIIYGPQSPNLVTRPLFLQFIDSALSEGKPTSFFNDEWRSPIFVNDIIAICQQLLELCPQLPGHSTYNMGGPERLSRVDMANKVAVHKGYDTGAVLSVPSASVQRPVASPPDISMSVERLVRDLPHIKLTPFSEALKSILK